MPGAKAAEADSGQGFTKRTEALRSSEAANGNSSSEADLARAPYFPAVDGLRFVGFLLVFLHHFTPTISGLQTVNKYGWVGVEIFFAISSFLFFTLFEWEVARFGKIDIARFFYRRILRLYPLLFLFSTAMALLYGVGPQAIARYVGLVTFTDNFMIWLGGYNTIVGTPQLWTISYEFQIYLAIPVAFLMYKALGRGKFFVLLAAVWTFSAAARFGFIELGSRHPQIWVTPFLRPDSTLAGIAIALGAAHGLHRYLIAAALAAGIALLVTFPSVEIIGNWTLAIYPLCGIISGGLLLLALDGASIVNRILRHRTVVYLGTISYGLYVFHLLTIYLTSRLFVASGLQFGSLPAAYATVFPCALLLTVLFATASWFCCERWILQLKKLPT